MTRHGVMLLIDGDNVSLDVMEQAIPWVRKHFGGPHVCRAYCTPESAVKHQLAFRRLGIRPMVNLAAGKNSTDIALAVDAIDLAIADRPEVVVIASSDSDFAPLVTRLREKGCRVVGVGQRGKTGEETQLMYDDFEVLIHQKRGGDGVGPSGASADPSPRGRGGRRGGGARRVEAVSAPEADAQASSRAPAAPPTSRAGRAAQSRSAAPVPTFSEIEPMGEPAPKAASRSGAAAKAPAKKAAAKRATAKSPATPLEAAAPARSAPQRPVSLNLNDEARAILQALPELARGGDMAINVAAERLRHAKVLSNRGSSTRLFAHYPDLFMLEPAGRPTRVLARQAVAL